MAQGAVRTVYQVDGKSYRSKIYRQDDMTEYVRHNGKIIIVEPIGREQIQEHPSLYTEIYKEIGQAKLVREELK